MRSKLFKVKSEILLNCENHQIPLFCTLKLRVFKFYQVKQRMKFRENVKLISQNNLCSFRGDVVNKTFSPISHIPIVIK